MLGIALGCKISFQWRQSKSSLLYFMTIYLTYQPLQGKKKRRKEEGKKKKKKKKREKKKCFKNTKKEDVSFKGKKERKQREKTANTHVEKHKHAPEICRGH